MKNQAPGRRNGLPNRPEIDQKSMKNRSKTIDKNCFPKMHKKTSKSDTPDLEKSSKIIILSSIFVVFADAPRVAKLIPKPFPNRPQNHPKSKKNRCLFRYKIL